MTDSVRQLTTALTQMRQRRNQLRATIDVLDERAAATPGPMTPEQRQALADAQHELAPLTATIERLERGLPKPSYQDLLARRAELWSITADLSDRVQTEGRAMTPSELDEWDRADRELLTVRGEIERLEDQSRIAAAGGPTD